MTAKTNAKQKPAKNSPEATSGKHHQPAPGFAKLLACEHGGIMMEYILLNMTIMVVLVTGGLALFNPSGAAVGDYGLFGQAFIDWYQRLVIGISLPLP